MSMMKRGGEDLGQMKSHFESDSMRYNRNEALKLCDDSQVSDLRSGHSYQYTWTMRSGVDFSANQKSGKDHTGEFSKIYK